MRGSEGLGREIQVARERRGGRDGVRKSKKEMEMM